MRDALGIAGGDILEACLFGSILEPQRSPNDVDLIVVTADGSGEPAWRRVREWRKDITVRFQARFGLPLSILIATPSEWREIDGTVVRRREPLL